MRDATYMGRRATAGFKLMTEAVYLFIIPVIFKSGASLGFARLLRRKEPLFDSHLGLFEGINLLSNHFHFLHLRGH